jgi:hypothetical protein
MNIKLLKLITGDDILTEVVTQVKEGYISIKNPVRVVVIPGSAGLNPNVGFAPWAPFSKETEFSLDKSHILVIMDPITEFVEQYKVTVSPIVTPPQGRLILPKK